jgi:multidrug efflux pump subunit AcrA (membrane-fusion protein)
MKRLSLRGWGNIGLAAVLIAASYWSAITFLPSSAAAESATRTAKVARGSVLSTVSASGNLAAATNLSLGFSSSGTLTEVDVKAGDTVTAGQVLAKINPASAQAALDTAKANLLAAQEKLSALTTTSTTTTTVAKSSSNNAQAAQQTAEANAKQYQAAVDKASKDQNVAQSELTAAQTALITAQSAGDAAATATAQQAVFAAQAKLSSAQTALLTAQIAQSTGTLRDQQTISAAQSSTSSSASSSNTSSSSTSATDGEIAQATAAVTTAQQSVDSAQTALDKTTLTAPVAGTIATVTAAVGDTVGSSSSSSSSSTGSSSTGTGSTTAANASTSSSSFITLVNLNSYQVKAGFSESDAAKVKTGEAATVTVDSASGKTFNAHVTSMDLLSTTVSNVVTYYAIVTLDTTDEALRPGMTATVSVVSNAVDNVLNVPTAAVQTSGTNGGTVTVIENGQQTRKQVQTGLKGDTSIEITSGLNEGDEVVVSTGTATTSSSSSNSTSNRSTTGSLTGSGSAGFGGAAGGAVGGPPGGF